MSEAAAKEFVHARELEVVAPADSKTLPSNALLVTLLGVNYVHVNSDDGGDLYLTSHGLRHLDLLRPENWYEKEWFTSHREKLEGTSAVYALPTREVQGRSQRLVVKYSRVGQQVPLATNVISEVLEAEFNGPFEEFSLVEGIRHSDFGPPALALRPQLPLCIYVPPERMQLWQTGRSEEKIARRLARYPGIEIDILRDYILVYEWLEGIDAVEACRRGLLTGDEVKTLTGRAADELKAKGFRVLDMKPEHVIVQAAADGGLARRNGAADYGLVDFELLERTPEYDQLVKASRRREYLRRQRDRFVAKDVKFPPYLKAMNVLGVDYVYGHTESTGGALWVVGRDPGLFDYFLPERWRKTPQIQLNPEGGTYYTRSKDNIHLVWKVSRLGEAPEADAATAEGQRLIECGYPSPFEEFALAMRLRERGVPTIYPRAIYMTGHRSVVAEQIADRSRFESHRAFVTPDGQPVLRLGRNYIAVWGYWNGPDEMLANKDGEYFKGINGAQAAEMGYLTAEALRELLDRERRRLRETGLEALRLRPEQVLLSLNGKGELIRDGDGNLETRICSFLFLQPRLPEN